MAWTLYKEIKYALAGIPSANITDMDQHVEITADAAIAAEIGSGGGVKFTSADGTTDLAFGLYPQTALTSGTVVATFKVSLLTAASVGDVIARLYYSATESTTEDKAGVYSAASALLDMEQDPSGSAPQMFDWNTETNIGTSAGSMTSGDLVTGQVGNGLDFDGTDDYVSLGDLSVCEDKVFTYLLTFKTTNVASRWIFGEGNSADDNPVCALNLTTGGKLRALFRGTSSIDMTGATTVNNGAFHSAALVCDGTNTKLFVDGSQDDSGGFGVPSGTVPVNRSAIGCLYRTSASLFAAVVVDEVAIYPSALSAARIAHWHVNRFANSTTFTLSAEQGGGGTTVTPSPVVASWSIPSPTLRKTRTIVPVSATWSTPAPTIRKSRTVEPVAATWATPAPSLAKSITPDPVGASWTVNATTLAKAITLDPVVATWTVTTPTTGNQIVVTPDPITATWSIPSITATKTIHPQPVSTSWQLPSPTLVKTRSVSPVVNTWTTTAPTLIKTTSLSTVSATWTVTALTTSKIVRPSPVLLTWAIADPSTSHDNPAPTLIRFASETFSNPSRTSETWAVPRFTNETFTE